MFNSELSDFYEEQVCIDTKKVGNISIIWLYALIEEAMEGEWWSESYEHEALVKVLKRVHKMTKK
jgi:hypothetical protein